MQLHVLTYLANVIARPLYNFSSVMETGRSAWDWRRANVTPIYFTSIPGKVMEQLLLETISRHTKEKKIMRSSQYGLSKGKSCLTNQMSLIDEKRTVHIVFLDFFKAFEAAPLRSS